MVCWIHLRFLTSDPFTVPGSLFTVPGSLPEVYPTTTQHELRLSEAVLILKPMKLSWTLEDEWLEWYRMTPQERWRENERLWHFYLSSGCSLEPEPDSQSPFDTLYAPGQSVTHGGTGLHSVRRGRI